MRGGRLGEPAGVAEGMAGRSEPESPRTALPIVQTRPRRRPSRRRPRRRRVERCKRFSRETPLYNMAAQYATGRVKSQARLGEIVEAARAGEREAFARLVEALWPDLVAFTRSVLGRAADAEDVVQDALIVAWQELPTLRSSAKFFPWVCKIAYRLALVALKKRSRLVPLTAAKREVIHLVTNDLDFQRLLAVLTTRQRAVLYLSLVEGWTASEIGAALGASLVTVRIHRMRALARLRRHVGVELP